MHAVFLDQQTFNSTIDLAAIAQQVGSLTCYQTTTSEQTLTRCLDADIVITNKVILDKSILEKLPNTKLICIAATGSNNVDLTTAKTQGIAVCNVAGYAKSSVAQYVFAQLLAYFQKTVQHNNNTEQGLWQQSPTFCYLGDQITELAGKTIGIVGYGDLGQSVKKIADAFDMKVLIAERPHATSIRADRIPFTQVLQQADIISLHCPQTPETINLINQQTLTLMKPSAVLINTARGMLVNNHDLIDALKNKNIAHAILDVLDQEPPPRDHLFFSDDVKTHVNNLTITAHIAWASMEAQERLISAIGKNIYAFNNNESMNRLV